VACLGLFVYQWQKGKKDELSIYISTVTLVFYIGMMAYPETVFTESTHMLPVTRWVYWSIVSPALVAKLLMVLGNYSKTVFMMLLWVSMIGFGIISALQTNTAAKYLFFSLSWILGILVFFLFFKQYQSLKVVNFQKWINISCISAILGFSFYPVLFCLGPAYGNVLDLQNLVLLNAIADIGTKIGLNLLLWFVYWMKIPVEEKQYLVAHSNFDKVKQPKTKVLFVEQNSIYQKLLRFISNESHMDPSFVSSLEEAKTSISENSEFDCMLVNLDKISFIRKDLVVFRKEYPGIFVIGYSLEQHGGFVLEHAIAQESKLHLCTECVLKDVTDFHELSSCINELISQHQAVVEEIKISVDDAVVYSPYTPRPTTGINNAFDFDSSKVALQRRYSSYGTPPPTPELDRLCKERKFRSNTSEIALSSKSQVYSSKNVPSIETRHFGLLGTAICENEESECSMESDQIAESNSRMQVPNVPEQKYVVSSLPSYRKQEHKRQSGFISTDESQYPTAPSEVTQHEQRNNSAKPTEHSYLSPNLQKPFDSSISITSKAPLSRPPVHSFGNKCDDLDIEEKDEAIPAVMNIRVIRNFEEDDEYEDLDIDESRSDVSSVVSSVAMFRPSNAKSELKDDIFKRLLQS